MSDPEVPQNEHKSDVDDVVDSANAGLADAEAARGDATRGDAAAQPFEVDPSTSANEPVDYQAVDHDLAAFEAAERDHPGTFGAPEPAVTTPDDDYRAAAAYSDDAQFSAASDSAVVADAAASSEYDGYDAPTRVVPSEPIASEPIPSEPIPSEPIAETIVAAPIAQHQPIFVQAPEPPRDRGNRGTAAGIGLLATLSFAILYLGTALGLQALVGDITGENIGEAALAPLMTWGFWVPVVVFFIGFWLLGAIINRGRWGLWVVFGLIVGLFAWVGHILGQLFEAPFWLLSAREGGELAVAEMLAPLAIAAFVFGRELTIWFGAWVARSGARKTELNAEAQREYERTIEAGPTLSR